MQSSSSSSAAGARRKLAFTSSGGGAAFGGSLDSAVPPSSAPDGNEVIDCKPKARRSMFKVLYCGSIVLDRHHSRCTLPWLVADLAQHAREQTDSEAVLKISPACVRIVPCSDSTVITHNLQDIQRYFRCKPDPQCFAYLIKNPDRHDTNRVSCHVLLSNDDTPIDTILRSMQHPSQLSGSSSSSTATTTCSISSASSTESSCQPAVVSLSSGVPGASLSSPSLPSTPSSTTTMSSSASSSTLVNDGNTSRFEVMYVGRADVMQRKPPSTFIDDCLARFEKTDLPYLSLRQRIRHRSESLGNAHSLVGCSVPEEEESCAHRSPPLRPDPLDEHAQLDGSLCTPTSSPSPLVSTDRKDSIFLDSDSDVSLMTPTKRRNNAMLLLIGLAEFRFISLDKKETLLVKKLSDVCRVMRANRYGAHIGLLCPSAGYDYYVCYIIKCENDDIVDTIMQSMRCAFTNALQPPTATSTPVKLPNQHREPSHVIHGQHSCSACPMEQYSKLCKELEGCNPDQIYETILLRIGFLDAEQQESVLTQYKQVEMRRLQQNDAHADANRLPASQSSGTLSTDGAWPANVHQRNVILMASLRTMCETLQISHEHNMAKRTDSVNTPNTSFDLMGDKVQPPVQRQRAFSGDPLRLSNKFNELSGVAKRSFNQSWNQLGRRMSRETLDWENDATEGSASHPQVPYSLQNSTSASEILQQGVRERSMSANEQPTSGRQTLRDRSPSPHITANANTPSRAQPRKKEVESRNTSAKKMLTRLVDLNQSPAGYSQLSMDSHSGSNDSQSSTPHARHRAMRRKDSQSWRHAIFTRITGHMSSDGSTSTGLQSRTSLASITSGIGLPSSQSPQITRSQLARDDSRRLSSNSDDSCFDPNQHEQSAYRSLWKKAIMQQILENRMKIQRKMKEEERARMEQLKLTYDEITPSTDATCRDTWTALLDRPEHRVDSVTLYEAVQAGIPRDLRARAWRYLMHQKTLSKLSASALGTAPEYNLAELLKQLTPHQHAILIDLGRTFPAHPYFSQHLGPGQLSLYNLLKAYSLYDQEVGYCQGLSFIAGALLLHTTEEGGFDVFVDLMYKVGLRKHYKPDMSALQIEMYQLSRLLHDRHPDLHEHLEEHEIPMLYAAPWFLTLFASTFPLGFVARVFDCMFLSGSLDVIFKIALLLMGEHKELIKQCNSFESINDFLKTTLPDSMNSTNPNDGNEMGIVQMEKIFNRVFDIDISRELLAYEVEYHVLQEEMLAERQQQAAMVADYPLQNGGSRSPPSETSGASYRQHKPSGSSRQPPDNWQQDQDMLRQITERLQMIQNENQRLRAQNDELNAQLAATKEQLRSVERSRHQLGSIEEQLRAALDAAHQYKTECATLRASNERLAAERNALVKRLNNNNNQVQSLN